MHIMKLIYTFRSLFCSFSYSFNFSKGVDVLLVLVLVDVLIYF